MIQKKQKCNRKLKYSIQVSIDECTLCNIPLLNVKMRIPKHVLVMGDSIFCIKKCLGYQIKMIFNALKTVALGAHFKPYI